MSQTHAPITVLMAEDDPDDRLLATESFRDAGVTQRIEFVPDGEALLLYLRRLPPYRDAERFPFPSLVLLDLNMPRLNGLETLVEMRADPDLRHLPVVVLTTSSSPADALRAYRAGCNAYIRKPATFAGLVDVVGRTVEYWLEIATLPVRP